MFVRGEVIDDQVQLLAWPSGPEEFEEGQELPPALALADPVGDLPGGKVQGSEHVPHPTGAPVGSPQPGRAPSRAPGAAGTGLQVQRPELIGADHPPVRRRMVIQVQDPAHLFDEPGVGGGLPGLGRQPVNAGLVQDLPDALPADRREPSRREVFGELG